MKIFKSLKKRVSYFGVIGDELIIVDEVNRVIKFDSSLNLKGGVRLKLPPNKPNEKGVKISKDGTYLIVTVNNLITLWDLKRKKMIKNFKEEKEVLCIGFDNENNYFASGDIAGKIFLYNLNIKKKVAQVAKYKDFINDLAISDDLNEIVAGCFDKCVLFVNLTSFNKKERYLHIKPVKKVENRSYVVSADEISDIVKWDLIKIDKKDRVDFYREFRDFWIDSDILVILGANKIMLYSLEREVILNDKFEEFANGDKIAVIGKYMVVSDMNGVLYYRDLFEEEKDLLDAILREDFKKAYELIDANPFLRRSQGFERLEKMVELFIKRAKSLFETDPAEAVKMLDKLIEVPHLRSKIKEIISHYSNLIKFKNAVKSGNYALAYTIANQYPLLKETKYYQLLEKKWQITFNKAFKLIEEGRISEAKELLEPFMAVTEKLPLIELLLREANIIKLMREKLAKRDFKGFFDLVKAHPELKNTAEYQNVINYANKLYQKALEFLEKEEFDKAKKAALILQDFPDFKDKAQKILEKIEIILKFLGYMANKEYEKALELVELYPFLKNLKSYKEFIKKRNEKILKAEELANSGKVNEAIELLKDYRDKFHLKRIEEIANRF